MIESITLAEEATFGNAPEVLTGLSKFDFIFGSNGTGKTTVSRVIADESRFSTCEVTWKARTRLRPMVYNRDFVDRNFAVSAELKGVFTLGKGQVGVLDKIATAKREFDEFNDKIEKLTLGVRGGEGTGGKTKELGELEASLTVKCWTQKKRHDAKLQGAFDGCRGSAEKFKAKIVQESTSNSSTLVTLAELEKKAESVFGQTPTLEERVPAVEAVKLTGHESNPILNKRVVGKDDVSVADMINRLGNSDWVRAGRKFYDENGNLCPFCQQSTTEAFAQSINEYFDETFLADSQAIDDLASNYATDTARLQQQLASIIAAALKTSTTSQ